MVTYCYVLINSTRSFAELGVGDITQRFRHERLTHVPATEIAMKHLGCFGRIVLRQGQAGKPRRQEGEQRQSSETEWQIHVLDSR